MILIGTLIKKLNIKTGISNGGKWSLQNIIIKSEDENHKEICLAIWNNRVYIAGLNVGIVYTFHCNIESHEHNRKWYTQISLWKVTDSNGKSIGNEINDDKSEIQNNSTTPGVSNKDADYVELETTAGGLKIETQESDFKAKSIGNIAECFGKECSIEFNQDELANKSIRNITLLINGGIDKIKCSKPLSDLIRQGVFIDKIDELRHYEIHEFINGMVMVVNVRWHIVGEIVIKEFDSKTITLTEEGEKINYTNEDVV